MHFLIKVSKFVSCSFAKFHFSVVPLLLLASLILLGKQKKRNMFKKKTIQALVYVMREKRQRS